VIGWVVRRQQRDREVIVMSMRRAAGYLTGAIAAAVSAEVATYPLWRNRCLSWGATREEAEGPLAGDDLLEKPAVRTTRAVTIETAPQAIWPWLVQMGPGRGGAYTYDWIENLLGLNMHSTNELLPEFQDLGVGDAWRLGRRGPVLRVAALDPDRSLVLCSDDGQWVWALVLVPVEDGTRLISRNRIASAGGAPVLRMFTEFVMEPGSLIMERKMLLGIKDRAERHPDAPAKPQEAASA
jgi:hypothetical protein